MSLNNKDVKKIKINKLLGIKDKIQIEVFEVKNIIYDRTFQKPQKNDIYNKLGKTIKNHQELYNIYDNKKLKEYYNDKKQEIKKKLYKFYNNSDKDDKLDLDGMLKLMKFSVDTPYKKEELTSLVEFIHFKYFDIQQKENKFIITYLYPAVEEVMREIYYSFVFNNKNFYDNLLSHELVGGGGLGPCFEQIVIANLSPTPSSHNKTIPNLLINKKKTIPYFIPKINEVNIPYMEDKIKLENNNIYLIDQKVFGGKSLDFIIIEVTGKEQIIYAFQASTSRKKMFKEDEIKYILKQMKEYITNNFFTNLKVKEDNLYFGYIFSNINEKEKNFKSMISTLNKTIIAYSYFNHKDTTFYSSKKRKINGIKEIVFNPFIQKPFLSFGNENLKIKRCMSICKIPKFKMIEDIEKKIKKTLKIIYNKEIIELDFQERLNKEYIFHFIYDLYFTQDSEGNSFFIIYQEGKFNIYTLDNLINNSNIYNDYLLNDKCEYDCYFIYSEGEEKKEPLYLDREKFLSEIIEPEKEKKEKIHDS